MDSGPKSATQIQICKAPCSLSIGDGSHKLLQLSVTWDGLSSLWNDFLGSLSLVYCDSLFSGRDSGIVLAVVNVTSESQLLFL